jgi:hypothetical protein
MEIFNNPEKIEMIGSYCFVGKCDTELQATQLRIAASYDNEAPYLGGIGLDIVCEVRNYDRAIKFISDWMAKHN